MVQTIKNNLKQLKTARISKLTLVLLLLAVVFNVLVFCATVLIATNWFTLEFLRAHVLHLIIIASISFSIFYQSYMLRLKKKPSLGIIVAVLLSMGVVLFTFAGLTNLLAVATGRGLFTVTNSSVLLISMLITTAMLLRYDFPATDSRNSLFKSLLEYLNANAPLFLTIAFLVAWGGLVNGSFVYLVVLVVAIVQLMLFKPLLANVKK